MECYFDNSATTKAFDEVAELVANVMVNDFGNPSSMHGLGKNAEDIIKNAKTQISKTLKCREKEILFTSGGTESDNIAIIGGARAREKEVGKHLITTKIEHPAVLETMAYLEKEGFEVTYLPVDENGQIRLEDLKNALRKDTALVSIMYVNNEIGAIEPIREASKIIKENNIKTYFHVDAVQGYGKLMINPALDGIDMMSVSSHKIHGPKGCGFLYIKDGVRIVPINYGGGQQKGLRSGTENVPGIAGTGLAAELIYKDFDNHIKNLRDVKNYFLQKIMDEIEDVKINGKMDEDSAPHIASVSISGVRAEVLLHALEDKEIYVSSGSACATNRPHLSETLKAINTPDELLDSTLRFSFSIFNTKEQVDYTIDVLKTIVPMLRRYTRQ